MPQSNPSFRTIDAALRHTVVSERARHGHSQSSFARAIGMSQANLSDYECARRGFQIETLVRVARALDMPLSRLVAKAERLVGGG